MILGVDHVALSCANIEASQRALEQLGFRTRFVEHNLPNSAIKKPFLASYSETHSIAYCESESGIAIELTRHNPLLPDGPLSYQVVLSGKSSAQHWPPSAAAPDCAEVLRASGTCHSPRAVRSSELQAQVWIDDDLHAPAFGGINVVNLTVADLSRATRLWQDGLQFRGVDDGLADDGSRWRRLELRRPVNQWSLDVVLREDNTPPGPRCSTLDQSGFPCLAFLCTNVRRDMERLLRNGAYQPTEVFSLTVAGRRLSLAFTRGVDGEILELIDASGRTETLAEE